MKKYTNYTEKDSENNQPFHGEYHNTIHTDKFIFFIFVGWPKLTAPIIYVQVINDVQSFGHTEREDREYTDEINYCEYQSKSGLVDIT